MPLIHDSLSTAVNDCLDSDGRCTKGFHNTVVTSNSFVKPNERVVYKRRQESDLLIVPHNSKILQDWDGHAHLDVCSAETVIYLYKYLYKGSKKDKLKLTNADDVRDDDEINFILLRKNIIKYERNLANIWLLYISLT